MVEQWASKWYLVCATSTVLACGDPLESPEPFPSAPSFPSVAMSAGGMVVTSNPYGTEAGIRMLERGGNAIDAAVAAAFALTVAEPTMSSLGGRTLIVILEPDGSALGIDGMTEIPASVIGDVSDGPRGYATIMIPGTVAALTHAVDLYGWLSMGEVVAPARDWAETGVVLNELAAIRFADVATTLDLTSEFARVFLHPDGRPPVAGDVLVRPGLADVLEEIAARGHEGFYDGWVAATIAADVAAGGGHVTLADLAQYRARELPIGRGRFAGVELLGGFLPSSGTTIIEILQIMDRLDATDSEVLWAAQMVESVAAGREDRSLALDMTPEAALAWTLSDSLASRRAAEIDALLEGASPGFTFAQRATVADPTFTTHLSVMDASGRAVALTQSIGPVGGSLVVTPGLGFIYASALGYLAPGSPGERPWSNMAPIAALRDDRPWLVVGAAGGGRIVTSIVEVVARIADLGMNSVEAVAAPRVRPSGDGIYVEQGSALAGGLRALGYGVEEDEWWMFGRLNLVEAHDGTYTGVGDPRWEGSSAGGPR